MVGAFVGLSYALASTHPLRPPADRLKRALLAAANSSDAEPAIPPLPEAFAHFRSELGEEVFGVGLGIARSDTQARRAANLRNYDFFSAPVAVIVSMDRKLASVDAMTVGMYLQTFLLALTESGVASCVEVSVAGYPEVIRKELGIAENMDILCGVAVGYEDDTMKVNHLRTMRSAVEETTVLLNA
ncbi:hypothetical protein B0T17DRAFT_618728 [Bombardia bombarda]|uniref:Nitroreductase domain-containing protein n=1 Tax=Bombardia bombarda TaxID=252184 RepID=A0AA40BY29_9PEZI|nr:hypothetical protein B0T17DRAFT_618728 [Bombardia bombarda]